MKRFTTLLTVFVFIFISEKTSMADWSTKSPMLTARTQFACVDVNGKIYVLGGRDKVNGNIISTIEVYDPTADTWTELNPMPNPRAAYGWSVNDIIYIIGGTNGTTTLTTVEAYDPIAETWTAKAPMNTPRAGYGIGVVDGIIYVFGGHTGSTRTNAVEAYDPATDAWTPKASMPAGLDSLSAAAVNGKIYIIGGCCDFTANTYEYDPATDTWANRAPMPTARCCNAISVMNGKIYVIAGDNQHGQGGEVNVVEVYDPETDTWDVLDPLPMATRYLSSSVVNGVIYAIGGDNDGPSAFNSVEAYDTCKSKIAKPYTFNPGDPAKASEVNDNFDALYERVNKLSCEIEVLKAIVCQDNPELDMCK